MKGSFEFVWISYAEMEIVKINLFLSHLRKDSELLLRDGKTNDNVSDIEKEKDEEDIKIF